MAIVFSLRNISGVFFGVPGVEGEEKEVEERRKEEYFTGAEKGKKMKSGEPPPQVILNFFNQCTQCVSVCVHSKFFLTQMHINTFTVHTCICSNPYTYTSMLSQRGKRLGLLFLRLVLKSGGSCCCLSLCHLNLPKKEAH